ncbi:MAG: carboxypeptidase-like regulatory domain-containing protein [Bacteroidia bacterium]
MYKIIAFVVTFIFCATAMAQSTATVYGVVRNGNTRIADALVGVEGTALSTTTNVNGYFELQIPASTKTKIAIQLLGYKSYNIIVNALQANERKQLEVALEPDIKDLGEAIIIDKGQARSTLTRIDPKTIRVLVNPNGSLESILKTLPGVVSNNELSSTYSVRGGSFDENLVYVNDIEVYRPFLVRSGQQEGLSFAYSNMVSNIQFSAGGFDAKYGDKMSSVLDIKYRKATTFGGSASAGILGGNLHIEGCSKNHRFTYQLGARHKQNSYLLKTLETKGDYKPRFTDVQTYLTYDVTENFELAFLGNLAQNNYLFTPTTRTTDFGTLQQFLRFTVYYDGQEKNAYTTSTAALTATYSPNKNTKLKFISSNFNTVEEENNNTQGQYSIDEVETTPGSSNLGDVKFNRGIGTFLNHTRNQLNARVTYVEHKGTHTHKRMEHLWGVRLQQENITDHISEWQYNDSSGYLIPYSANVVQLPYVLKSDLKLQSTRISGYYQNKFNTNDSSIYGFSTGVRFSYWNVNKQLLISPRATLSIIPKWEKKFAFRVSSGVYNQPPFYREMRDFKGQLNTSLKAQQSIHFVGAMDHIFTLWKRPFKLTTEAYYKILNNLVPYEVDNVRLRYFATNNSKGYAYGADAKLNGEFVKNAESWFSLSYLKTAENLTDDSYYNYYNKSGEKIFAGYTFDDVKADSIQQTPGYIRRPTDQRITLGIFFQDYIERFPWIKMNLNLVFGSGMPYGPPTQKKYQQVLSMRPYRRVDIGTAFMIKDDTKEYKNKGALRFIKGMWINVDVFNVLGLENEVSVTWIKDISNHLYPVPNNLSARLINFKLSVVF